MNGLSRYKRVLRFIENLEKEKQLKNKTEIKNLHQRLKSVGYKIRTLETIRVIAAVLLYSSVTSAILSIIPGFDAFSKNIVYISSIVGSTVFLIVIGVTSKLITLYVIDLHLISSQLISIYTKK